MVSDSEPRYRLVDSNGNVVGSLYAEADGTLKLQEGTSGSDNEVSVATDGTLTAPAVSTDAVDISNADLSSGSVINIRPVATYGNLTFSDTSYTAQISDAVGMDIHGGNIPGTETVYRAVMRADSGSDTETVDMRPVVFRDDEGGLGPLEELELSITSSGDTNADSGWTTLDNGPIDFFVLEGLEGRVSGGTAEMDEWSIMVGDRIP